jgi:hypothetical protein
MCGIIEKKAESKTDQNKKCVANYSLFKESGENKVVCH